VFLVVAALVTMPALSAARSEVRREFGPEIPYSGPPYYAQISYTRDFGWEIYHTGEWAAIPFYRDPACVPRDFNLLDMFDVPAAFDCSLAVRGFEIFTSPAAPPKKSKTFGLGAVSIYFVRWSKLREAVDDYWLGMPELEALVSAGDAVVGSASFFVSELHPSGGTAVVPHIEISASGLLQDNRHFVFQVAGGDQSALVKHVSIVFEQR
jgi:hypothetical protein